MHKLSIARRCSALALAGATGMLVACQTPSAFDGPEYSDATRQMEADLMTEARALGAAQGAAGIAASFDRSGAASLLLMHGGQAARNELMRRADRTLREQLEKDSAAFLRQYGIEDDEPGPEPGIQGSEEGAAPACTGPCGSR